jgi:tetratricopeptide (TPR) repeat protein
MRPFRYFVLSCLLLSSPSARAQDATADSLLRLLPGTTSDSLRCILCLHISTEYTQSRPDSALMMARKALDLARGIKDTVLMFHSAHQAGLCASDNGQYERALEYQNEALVYNVRPPKTNEARPMAAMANIFSMREDYKTAYRYSQRAYEAFARSKDTVGMLNQLTDLGSLHAEMGHWAQSLDCHKRVLVWASPRHALFVRMANNNIGNTLFRQGQIREAIPYFEKCLQMSISAADKEGQLLGHANLGKVYLSLKMTNEALEQYNKSLALCQQFGDPSSAEMVWKGLANAHEQKGDFKSALHAWKNYHALYDSIE